jgi:signal transduction histidine kinase
MESLKERNAAAADAHYRAALAAYLEAPHELARLAGYDLGRRALTDGLGVLEMAAMHSRALTDVIQGAADDERQKLIDEQTAFLVEALSPFEMAHRAFQDANTTLRRLNDVMEGQAKRIAYALHNEAGQLLASVHFALAEAGRDLPPEKTEHLSQVRSLLSEIEQRLRNLSHELRPTVLDDLGLPAAIEFFSQSVKQRWGLPVTVHVAIDDDLPASIENTIYRIVQEALTNAAKHAEATCAAIEVRQVNRRIVCSVRDNGVGLDDTDAFRKRRPGLGLIEIRERVEALGGVVRVRLHEEKGTDLTFEIPVDI